MPSATFSVGLMIGLVAIVLLAAWLIHRAGAELRGQVRPRGAQGAMLTPEQVRAITSRGLATPEQLFSMSAKEQQLLAATAIAMQGDQSQRRTREQ